MTPHEQQVLDRTRVLAVAQIKELLQIEQNLGESRRQTT